MKVATDLPAIISIQDYHDTNLIDEVVKSLFGNKAKCIELGIDVYEGDDVEAIHANDYDGIMYGGNYHALIYYGNMPTKKEVRNVLLKMGWHEAIVEKSKLDY